MIEKVCFRCKQTLPIDLFGKQCNSPTGYAYVCRKCKKEDYKIKSDSFIGRIQNLITTSKGVAKRKGWEHTLTQEFLISLFLKQEGKCALTDDVFSFERHSKSVMSLDRIDSLLGYIPENVHLVTAKVNIHKNSASIEDFLEVCRKVNAKYHNLPRLPN